MNLTARARELRKQATRAENFLWYEHLRFCSPRVRRQHVLAGFIVDFYCPKLHLAIELDGAVHDSEEAKVKDFERTAILETHGVKVVRFENWVVLKRLEVVVDALEALGLERAAPSASLPPPPNLTV